MLGIVGAQVEEVREIKELMRINDTKIINGMTIYHGYLDDKEVALIQGGIGKVGVTISVSTLLNTYPINYLINVGTCAGYNDSKVKPYDIVIGNEFAYYDVDVTAFNYVYGQMAGCPKTFKSDVKISQIIFDLGKSMNYPMVMGDMLCGDNFVTNQIDLLDKITNKFNDKNVISVDMESTAVAQCCYMYKIPFIVLRTISDILNAECQKDSYETVLKVSSKKIARLLQKLMKFIKEK